MTAVQDPVTVAWQLAEEVLLPAAIETDRLALPPVAQLDALAGAGLYGLVGPREYGGLAAGEKVRLQVVEALAAGCLTSAFLWVQHQSAVQAVAMAAPELRDRWLADLCVGRCRAGVALALRRPGPPLLRAVSSGAGWVLDGVAPWVSGWGVLDVLHVAAVDQGRRVVWSLIDVRDCGQLQFDAIGLSVLGGTATGSLSFRGLEVPAARVTHVEPVSEWHAGEAQRQRMHGAMSLGVATRCGMLLGPGPWDQAIKRCRGALMDAPVAELAQARVEAALLAVRLAATAVASAGGSAVRADRDQQRLAREATFLLVFGQTSATKSATRAQLWPGG